MAQLMPLPLTVSCFTKIQIGFTFLVPAHPGSRAVITSECVCVCGIGLRWLLRRTKSAVNERVVVGPAVFRSCVFAARRRRRVVDRRRLTDGRAPYRRTGRSCVSASDPSAIDWQWCPPGFAPPPPPPPAPPPPLQLAPPAQPTSWMMWDARGAGYLYGESGVSRRPIDASC